MPENPYFPPSLQENQVASKKSSAEKPEEYRMENELKPSPGISPAGTTLARHMAATVDSLTAIVLSFLVAQQVPEELPVWVAITVVVVYLGYFFLLESAFGTTLGKFSTGLKIVSYNGSPCNTKQIAIRTLFRLLETNPLLLGAIPAAARIIFSREKQRFGDRLAGTIVVFRNRT
jgi:uncharacterized RDD family membrane protein YckC